VVLTQPMLPKPSTDFMVIGILFLSVFHLHSFITHSLRVLNQGNALT
jgi:hypothetical protein